MNIEATWFLVIGGLVTLMGLARGFISSLPMTGAMVYLAVGFVLGPAGAGLLKPDLHAALYTLRLLTEVGLVISLFAIGLYLRVPLHERLWLLPVRLGTLAMVLTIAFMMAIGHYALGLGAGVALVLAAALAPTDPVLANELRPREAGDDEPLRFALSGEGGCNDAAAYPFVLLGLALCGAHEFSLQDTSLWLAFLVSLIWGVASGLVIGWIFGTGLVALVTRLRTRHGEALGLEGFFALGLMALCYGVALLVHGYGFLAVFAAGVALRRRERQVTGETVPNEALQDVARGHREEAATSPELAPAYLAESMRAFSVDAERIVELALMLLIGSVVSAHWRELLDWRAIWPVLVLFFIVRPVSTSISLIGSSMNWQQRLLTGWLGIRGVGAFYYLLFALGEISADTLGPIIPVVFTAIVASVLLHGMTATFLLERYFRSKKA